MKEIVKFFSIDFNPINTSNLLNTHKYSMKGTQYKTMSGIIQKMSIELLA